MQIKVLYFFLVVLAIALLGAKEAEADCCSRNFKGPCPVWHVEACERACEKEGRETGYCYKWSCYCRKC